GDCPPIHGSAPSDPKDFESHRHDANAGTNRGPAQLLRASLPGESEASRRTASPGCSETASRLAEKRIVRQSPENVMTNEYRSHGTPRVHAPLRRFGNQDVTHRFD